MWWTKQDKDTALTTVVVINSTVYFTHTDGYIHREGGRNDTETGDSQIGKLHLTSMREIYTLRIIIFTQRRSKITRNHH